MAGTGTAPALTRAIVGPVFTGAGFQFWYLACFPDCIVAVRQGMWNGLLLAMASARRLPVQYGLLGILVAGLMKRRGKKLREQAEPALQIVPTSRLRMKPNAVYQLMQLHTITLTPARARGIVKPEITIETKSGGKQKYGIETPDFDKGCALLRQMYPGLCK